VPILEPINSTTYGGKLHLDDIEIGDITASEFKPHIKMKRFNGLCDLALSYPTSSTKLVVFFANKLVFPESNNVDIEIYPKDPDELNPEGAVELNIILKKKPVGNKNTIVLKLETDTIDFQKILGLDKEYDQARCQEKWTEDEPDGRQGTYTITPTSIIHDASGEVMKERPEYLVNSYQGKAKQNYRVTSEFGEIKANTPNKGKQLKYTRVSRTTAHIRRGKMIDADGVEAWVENMNLDPDGTLTFTLPKDFIKNAKYPIRQAVGVDPAYTEDMDFWVTDTYGDSDNTWSDYDLFTEKGVPKGAVAEIIFAMQEPGVENTMGVRTDGSSLNRRVTLHEAEGGGVTTCRMFVLCDASTGLIEGYHSDVSDDDSFYLVGYWENVGFTEVWAARPIGNNNIWEDITLSTPAGQIGHILVYNGTGVSGQDVANTMGVRTNGSSLERKVLVHESEGNGSSIIDMLVKAAGSSIVELYTSEKNSASFGEAGYFGSEMDFVELFQLFDMPVLSGWRPWDATEYLDQDGRVCDFLLTHDNISGTETIGVRDGDDTTTERKLTEHEAEDDGGSTGELTGFGMSAQSNASGVVNYVYYSNNALYLMGYFKPAIGVQDYPISLSPGLTASATVAYLAAWDRSVEPGLTANVVLAYKAAWDRSVDAGLTTAVTIAKSYGWKIVSSADLTISATVAYLIAYKRTVTANLTTAVTILKGWGRSITTTAGLTVSTTIAVASGFKKALSAGLAVSTTIAKTVAYKRATSPGLTVLATIARALAYHRATQSALSVTITVLKGWGRTIITSPSLTVSATIVKSWGRKITTTTGLTAAVSLVKSFNKMISTSTNLSLSVSISVSAVRRYLITVATNLGITISINRVVGYTRATTSNLSLSISIVWFRAKAIPVTVYLYGRSLTAKLYQRTFDVALYKRAFTASLYLRDMAIKLYKRAFTTKIGGA